ncbi:hypothetical protein [Rhizobium sp. No.120]
MAARVNTIIVLSREDDAAVTAAAPILKSLIAADWSQMAEMQQTKSSYKNIANV